MNVSDVEEMLYFEKCLSAGLPCAVFTSYCRLSRRSNLTTIGGKNCVNNQLVKRPIFQATPCHDGWFGHFLPSFSNFDDLAPSSSHNLKVTSQKREESNRICGPMGVALLSLAIAAEMHELGGLNPNRSACFFLVAG